MAAKKLHATVRDSSTGEVLIDEDLNGDTPAENPTVVGTHDGPGTIQGPVYVGVKVWVAPRSRVFDWEPEGDSVFVSWEDRSSSNGSANSTVHTVERALPGGGIGRFLVTVE